MDKTCSICKVPKPVSEFGSDKRRPDGRRSSCNICRHEHEYVKNADKIKARLNIKYATDDSFREKARTIARERYKNNPEELKARSRRTAYYKHGISTAQFNAMQVAQDYTCLICGRTAEEANPYKKDLCIDHDHFCCPYPNRSCGKCIRGLLCHSCNVALGFFHDSPVLLQSAIDYLAKWKAIS